MENPETGLPEEGGACRVTSPQPSTVTWTRESHDGCVNRARTRPPDLTRFHQPLRCLMTSESFGCHDISRHRWGGPAGGGAASASRSGLTRSLWRCKALSGRNARGWGATGRGSGALWVGGAFVQYAQPLASRSRPSWSRPTHADSGRGRRPTTTKGPSADVSQRAVQEDL